MELRDYLIIGSYLFGAASWGFLWKAIRTVGSSVEQLRLDLAFNHGKSTGEDHERRITTLEHSSSAPLAH